MYIIISPAKRMREDQDSLPWRDLPRFLPRTEQLLAALRGMSPAELKALWKCNDRIAALNVQRLREMDLRQRLTPAVLPISRNICGSSPAFTGSCGPLTG